MTRACHTPPRYSPLLSQISRTQAVHSLWCCINIPRLRYCLAGCALPRNLHDIVTSLTPARARLWGVNAPGQFTPATRRPCLLPTVAAEFVGAALFQLIGGSTNDALAIAGSFAALQCGYRARKYGGRVRVRGQGPGRGLGRGDRLERGGECGRGLGRGDRLERGGECKGMRGWMLSSA
eukprot:353479-Chlamydomonas_euryale.AAC.1